MPNQLREHLPPPADEMTAKTLFSDVTEIRTLYEFDDPLRQGTIAAYRNSLWHCLAVSLGLPFEPLVAAFF